MVCFNITSLCSVSRSAATRNSLTFIQTFFALEQYPF